MLSLCYAVSNILHGQPRKCGVVIDVHIFDMWKQVEKSFLQNEEGYGMTRSTKKKETHSNDTQNDIHDTIPHLFIGKVSDKDKGMVSCTFVYHCCVMTLVNSRGS